MVDLVNFLLTVVFSVKLFFFFSFAVLSVVLDGQRQRADIPAHARIAHYGIPQKRLEEDLC